MTIYKCSLFSLVVHAHMYIYLQESQLIFGFEYMCLKTTSCFVKPALNSSAPVS